jgi:acetyl-CoA carboxylase biotin carboxylase subunit
MFSRILVACRGEIALRVIRACRELGVETVAVFSEADRGARYLELADHAICIGPASPAESYLNIPRILSAAEVADVEAIHPGYGFLAENAHFAEVCESCNIKFIGPSSRTLQLTGNKVEARRLAADNRVPVVPGSDGAVAGEEEAVEAAHRVGYPVMLKAAAGGGGRGMRIAHNDISLRTAYHAARSEAEAAFGDGSIYVEKQIPRARHVEVQILADEHGNLIHLGERDCTIQRRHQKLVEEAPSPAVNERLRYEFGRAALRVARAANYTNAGTVEFLLDPEGHFYFIEVNARIQVEHPVTEMVTGVDIVKEQIRIAAGEPLSVTQRQVVIQGAAIECRINAEDYTNGFKPSSGSITQFIAPGGPGVRLDTHAYPGYTVSPYYDSLIAKLVVHKPTRQEAIQCMRRALEEFHIDGIKTTIPLYAQVFQNRRFVDGHFDTGFIDSLFLG